MFDEPSQPLTGSDGIDTSRSVSSMKLSPVVGLGLGVIMSDISGA